MTPEEFQRLKEAEKAHLRKIRELKGLSRSAVRTKKITGAVTDMVSSMESLLEEHRDMTDRLSHDAALQEARLEIALESADERAASINQEAQDEADLVRAKAEQRAADVKQMDSGEAPPQSPSSMPEKTIGRMKR